MCLQPRSSLKQKTVKRISGDVKKNKPKTHSADVSDLLGMEPGAVSAHQMLPMQQPDTSKSMILQMLINHISQ